MTAGDDPYVSESTLVDHLFAGDHPELLADLFAARAERWPYPTPYDLAPFADLFGYRRSRAAVPAPVAFALIPAAVRLLLDQEPGSRLEWAFDLLAGLAHASDTTQLPSELATQWESLRRRAAELPPNAPVWRSLQRWYRIA